MVLPITTELVRGSNSGWIDANLIRGVTGAVALESVSESGGTLTITYRDESNAVQTINFMGGGGSSFYYPIALSDVGGTANAITLTTGQSLTSYETGQLFFFNSIAQNTGAVTLNVDGVGALQFRKSNGLGGGSPMTGGEITTQDPIFAVYDARFNEFYWIPGHLGTAAQRDIGSSEDHVPILGANGVLNANRLASGGTDGQVLARTSSGTQWVDAGDDLIVVDTYGDLPTPLASTVGVFYYIQATKDIFITVPITEFGVPQSGTFTDLGSDPNAVLVFNVIPPGQSSYAGRYAYGENQNHFYLADANPPYVFRQTTPSNALDPLRSDTSYGVHFIGHAASDAEALGRIPTIPSATDIFYAHVHGSGGSIRRLDLSSYTEAVNPTTIYEWGYAVDHVRANPNGTAVQHLNKLQIQDIIYDFNLGGTVVGLRDELAIADTSRVTNTFAGPMQGNVYEVTTAGGINLIRAIAFVANSSADDRQYDMRIYRGSYSDGTLDIQFDELLHDGSRTTVAAGATDATIRHTFDEPPRFNAGELIYVSTVRVNSNDAGQARSSTNLDIAGSFVDLPRLEGLDFRGIVRRVNGNHWGIGDTETILTIDPEAYRQHILLDHRLSGADLDLYGGTHVISNPTTEDARQTLLQTVSIAGETFRVQDRTSEGNVLTEGDYTLENGANTIAGDTVPVLGAIFETLPRPFRFREVRARVQPTVQSSYRAYLCLLTRVNDTTYNINEIFTGSPDWLVSAGVRGTVDCVFGYPDGIDVDANEYFAVLIYNIDGNDCRIIEDGTPYTETNDTAPAFQQLSRARLSAEPANGNNVFNSGGDRPYMEITYEVSVPRVIEFRHEGNHVRSAPQYVDFTGRVDLVDNSTNDGIEINILAAPPQLTPHTDIISSPLDLVINDFSVALSSASYTNIPIVPVAKADIEAIDLMVRVNGTWGVAQSFQSSQMNRIGYVTGYNYTYSGQNRVPCIFYVMEAQFFNEYTYTFNVGSSHNNIQRWINADRPCILIFMVENSAGTHFTGIDVVGYDDTSAGLQLEVAVLRHA